MRKVFIGKETYGLKTPPLLSGEGERFTVRKIFKGRAFSAFPVGIRFEYRLFRFCSPVPEREGGQGEGFDFTQLAKDCYAHTVARMRKIIIGKETYGLKTPPPVPFP